MSSRRRAVRSRPVRTVLGLAGASTAVAPAPGRRASAPHAAPVEAPPERRRSGLPALKVRTVVAGLDNPWDVQPIGGGRLLVTERDRARLSVVRKGKRRTRPASPSARCGSPARPG